jgi:hypothetical protein
MIEEMTASEEMLKVVSKTLGFNQVTMVQVSSLDIAEICWYEAQDQPGIKPVFALYPSKRFRLHVSRYLADERVLPYVRNTTVDDDNFPSTKPLSVEKSHQALTASTSRNEYSYGVRVREMEDQMLLEYTMRISEKEFLEVFDKERLLNQQALADGLADAHNASVPVKPKPSSNEKADPMVLQNLIQRQIDIEESCIDSRRKRKERNFN